MRYTQCAVPGVFVNNEMFTMRSHSYNGKNIMSEEDVREFEVHGRLSFLSKEEAKVRGYDTVGFAFYKDYAIYDNTAHNLQYGLHRLFAARKDSLELHQELEEIQEGVRLGVLKGYIDKMVELFQLSFINCEPTTDHEAAVLELAKMPHVKQKLRMRAYRTLVARGLMLDDLYMVRVKGKLKTKEKAKVGKKPRVIGDYTTEGSLLGGYLIGRFKQAFTLNILDHNEDFIQFCDSPKVEVLSAVFKRHLETVKFGATYYSDDSIFSIRSCEGELLHYCVDISSCDVSNGNGIFNLLMELCESDPVAHKVVKRLVAQCAQNFEVAHPHNRDERYVFKTSRPVEYSGSSITTVLNNVATSLIGISVYHAVKGGVKMSEMRDTIMRAARDVGYIVTVSERTDFASLQFLKNSPGRDGRAYVNLGVLLRGLGSTNGDFPGRGDLGERIEDFASSVVAGYVHCGNHIITRALRERFSRGVRVAIPSSQVNYTLSLLSGVESTIEDGELAERYRCSVAELEQLADCIRRLRVGDVINVPASDKIFNLDYEYPQQLG